MTEREIIRIDEEKCIGCGDCIPGCPEGALQLIDGKARLVSDLFCDGLGACIGSCPVDAIEIEMREAEPYDEKQTMANIVPHGMNTVKAHLVHLREHGEMDLFKQAIEYLKENDLPIPDGVIPQPGTHPGQQGSACGCPGSAMQDFTGGGECVEEEEVGSRPSRLRQWPVQIMLVPPSAPYLNKADLVISADCVPFAYPDFHEDFLKDRILMVGCPKLDDAEFYRNKLAEVFRMNDIRSATVVHMEVPCCFGMVNLVKGAISDSGKTVPFADVTITVKGEKK